MLKREKMWRMRRSLLIIKLIIKKRINFIYTEKKRFFKKIARMPAIKMKRISSYKDNVQTVLGGDRIILVINVFMIK